MESPDSDGAPLADTSSSAFQSPGRSGATDVYIISRISILEQVELVHFPGPGDLQVTLKRSKELLGLGYNVRRQCNW